MTPAQFIEILKAASPEQLAEIRSLLGVPNLFLQADAVPIITAPDDLPIPKAPPRRFIPWCGGGHGKPMVQP
jgi:hypothetical protein